MWYALEVEREGDNERGGEREADRERGIERGASPGADGYAERWLMAERGVGLCGRWMRGAVASMIGKGWWLMVV